MFTVYVSPVPECFGDGHLARSCVSDLCGGIPSPSTCCEGSCEGIHKAPPQVLPTPQRAVTVRQYCPPGGHKEIGANIAERQKWTLYILHSPFSSSVWAVWKPDGSGWMTVDYRELNKVLGTYHYVVDLANAFFLHSYSC